MVNNITNSNPNAFNPQNALKKAQTKPTATTKPTAQTKPTATTQSQIVGSQSPIISPYSVVYNNPTKSDTFTPTKPDERGFITGRPMNPFSEIYNNPIITISPIEGPIPAPIITISPIFGPIPDPKITLSPIESPIKSPIKRPKNNSKPN